MPIWLRKFTFNSIQEFYNKEKEESEKLMAKAKGKGSKGNTKSINMANPADKSKVPQSPTYSTSFNKNSRK